MYRLFFERYCQLTGFPRKCPENIFIGAARRSADGKNTGESRSRLNGRIRGPNEKEKSSGRRDGLNGKTADETSWSPCPAANNARLTRKKLAHRTIRTKNTGRAVVDRLK